MAEMSKIAFIGLFVALAITACDNSDSDTDFPTNIGLTGRIDVQNQYQQPLYNERDGIKVLLEVGYRSFSVQADNIGYYDIDGTPVGTYSATYSKPGYGTIINRDLKVSTANPSFQVVNGRQVLPTVALTKIPNTSFADEALSLNYQIINETDTIYTLKLSARIVPGPPPTGQAKGYRVFIGTDPLLAPSNYLYQSHHTTLTDTFSLTFGTAFIDTNGIASGDMVYALLYGDANFDVQQKPLADEVPAFPNLSLEPGALTSIALP